jgi:hypothetical protein
VRQNKSDIPKIRAYVSLQKKSGKNLKNRKMLAEEEEMSGLKFG